MKFVAFGNGTLTLELTPADCFILAEACEAAVNFDAATNLTLVEAMREALTAGALVAAAPFDRVPIGGMVVAEVRKVWLPQDDRRAH